MLIHNSPQLFAVYHVFLRLRLPRHPPNALTYRLILTIQIFRYLYLFSTKNLFFTRSLLQKNFVCVYLYTYFLDFLIIQYFHIILFSFFLIYNVL